jgi:hypothetical protein
LRSFLHDLVCLVAWIFLQVLGATYEMCVRGEYVAIPNPLDLVHIYKFLKKKIWIQKIFCSKIRWLSYVGVPALTYDASAICQDPNLFLPEADSKELVVPVCHRHTSGIGYLTKLHHLAILSNST